MFAMFKLLISVNDRMISLLPEDFIFTKLRMRSFAKIKHSRKFPNLQQIGNSCSHNHHLRYIVVYIVGDLVLLRRVDRIVKRDFWTEGISEDIPQKLIILKMVTPPPPFDPLVTFSLQSNSRKVVCCVDS